MKWVALTSLLWLLGSVQGVARTPEKRCVNLLNDINSRLFVDQDRVVLRQKIDQIDRLYPQLPNNAWWKAKSDFLNGMFALVKDRDVLQAKARLLNAEQGFKAVGDQTELAYTYFGLAILTNSENNVQQTTDYSLRTIAILEKELATAEINQVLALAYDGLAAQFMRVNDRPKELLYKQKARAILVRPLSTSARRGPPGSGRNPYILNALSLYYEYAISRQPNQLQKAHEFAQRSYAIALAQDNLPEQAAALPILISYHSIQNNLAETLRLCDMALLVGHRVDKSLVFKAMFEKVNCLWKEGDSKTALRWSDSLLVTTQTLPIVARELIYRDALKQRYQIHKQLGQSDEALRYAERFIGLEDRADYSQRTQIVNELETKYQTEKKQKEILLLTAQNQIEQVRVRQKNGILVGLALVSLLFLGGLWFWLRQRTAQQKQLAAEMKQRLLRAQLNPHFLFNSLNSIQRLYVEGRISQANEFIADFAQLMRDILEKTSRTTIPLYEEIDFIEAYLSLEKRRLGNKFDYEIVMDEAVRHSEIEVPSFIIQPLAENALLHGVLPREGQKGKI
ncbi:MAG: hypothetical protein EAZ91_02020, partial [Cytophagales bacterium]